MKPEQQALFTDDVLTHAAGRFGLDPDTIRHLDGFENMVLEAERYGQPYILRISHNSHRTIEQVHAELDWIDFLAQRDVSVCRPLRSKTDALIEIIDIDRASLIAAVFEKAKGGMVRRDDQTPQMTYNRGRLLGKIHALTKQYRPQSDEIKRYQWYDEEDFANFDRYLGPADEIVGLRFRELIDSLRAIPVDDESYGLIHTDAHTGNIFFDGDNPTLFDFDDCAYDFFISDIAISLFYAALMLPPKTDQLSFAKEFLDQFLAGYRTENRLDDRWLELMPMILKRRELVLYVAIHRGYDTDNLDEWCTRYLVGRRERIEKRVPYLDFNWTDFSLSG